MNSLIIILLAETCLILLVVLVVVLWLQIKANSNQKKAVEQLVSQIKQQSKTRTEETGSFLQDSYNLTDTELKSAVKEIDKQERKFFQKLVDILSRSDIDQITSLDASVAELVDTYKSLKPRTEEKGSGKGSEQGATDIEALKIENSELNEELEKTRETMANMIKEFGSMFGGGQDNELDSSDVVEKVNEPVATDNETEALPVESEKQPDTQ